MKRLNLQFALAAMLLAAVLGICVDYFRVEAEIERTRTELQERRARLEALPELLAPAGSAPAQSTADDALRHSARLGQAQIVGQEASIDRADADARSRAALGRLALVTGAGVLCVAWLNLRRRLISAAAQI